MLEKYLQDIGLSEKEAAVYVALIQFESASAPDVARKTNLKRPTAYAVLESLVKKGLVSHVAVGTHTRYAAEPPERLRTFIERQKLVLEERAEKLTDIIPQLRSIQKESGEKPIVKYLEGREGILQSYEESLAVKKEGEIKYSVFSRDLGNEFFTEKERAYLKEKRMTKDIPGRTVYTYSGGELPAHPIVERVRIDEGKYPVFSDIDIYGDEVRIHSFKKNLFSLYIRSRDIAETLKSLISHIIDTAKK